MAHSCHSNLKRADKSINIFNHEAVWASLSVATTSFSCRIKRVRYAAPQLPILWFRTLDDQVNRSHTDERLLAALSGSFRALALLLSLIGTE